jgi:hypothetical protein
MLLPDTARELHFAVGDLAKTRRVRPAKIRRLIKGERGVIRAVVGKQKLVRHFVPESVARRVQTKLSALGLIVTAV